jgi:Sulfotransferase domain.
MRGFYWIASYPKSGNTWLRLSLSSLQFGGQPIDAVTGFAPVAASCSFFEDALHVDAADLTAEEIACLRPRQYEQEAVVCGEPMFRKVHDARTLTPAGEPLFPPAVTLGALYIVRDPRDVAVSLAHQTGRSLDAAIAILNNPEARMGGRADTLQLAQPLLTWSAHVESWLDGPGPKPLLVRYEDMKADAAGQLARVAAHVGWTVTEQAVAAAVAATRFEVLRAREEAHGFGERLPGMDRFFRRGVAGGWRDSLSPAQAAQVERDHGLVMARLGYASNP